MLLLGRRARQYLLFPNRSADLLDVFDPSRRSIPFTHLIPSHYVLFYPHLRVCLRVQGQTAYASGKASKHSCISGSTRMSSKTVHADRLVLIVATSGRCLASSVYEGFAYIRTLRSLGYMWLGHSRQKGSSFEKKSSRIRFRKDLMSSEKYGGIAQWR